MKIYTKFFGEIIIDDNDIITFNSGIPGFEEYKKFIILDLESKSTLKCLQSTESKDVCLVIINPWDYFNDYQIELSDDEVDCLEIEKEEDVLVYNVLTIRQDKITANLLAPIVINSLKKKGKQIILSNTNYKIRQEIVCL
ncbi:flagellar assembly protein FliW [Caloramator sp. E03]|uniref:flagellar assembly protein FliW n=1 Tax=Caloramator sp. E03 TaxID=2576307 RepID=UPI001110B499|nr:flagellar assembly protein FliW [Caloramator sp. E03]QCX32373.1 flagellar assembly protein FliW [Caloramator sp. E03]